MLLYIWILSAVIVPARLIDFIPSTLHHEPIQNEEEKPVKTLDVKEPVNTNASEPFKNTPTKKDNVYMKGENENLLKGREVDKLKSQINKTESGKVVSTTDTNLKLENLESVNQGKEKVKKTKNETVTKNTEDVIDHTLPPNVFPVSNTNNVSEAIHGLILPLPEKKFPKNNSTILKGDTDRSDHIPRNVLSTPSSKPTDDIIESSKTNNSVTVENEKKMDNKPGSSEATDMNNRTKYGGECDVDDDKHIANKTNIEKCVPKVNSTDSKTTKPIIPEAVTVSGQHPDSEILPAHFNKSGPHLISKENGEKQVGASSSNHDNNNPQSVHINTDKMSDKIVAAPEESHKESSVFRITRKGVTIFVVSLATLSVLGYVALVIWKKMMLRRSGREILINEDEFCDECTDSHEFEMNQQQNRNIII